MKIIKTAHIAEIFRNYPDASNSKLADELNKVATQETDKLRALLEGLGTQNIDKLMSRGKVGDFRNYGKAYLSAVKDKVDSSFKKGAHQALDEAAEKVEFLKAHTAEYSDWIKGYNHSSDVLKQAILSLKEKY